MNEMSVIRIIVLTAILTPGIALSLIQTTFAQEEITWIEGASQHRGQIGKQVTYRCPQIVGIPQLPIWGTDVYTDDSPVCLAAIHAGAITTQGGTVTIEIRPGQASYVGSTRNGVTTLDFGVFGGSYIIIPPTPTPTHIPSCPPATSSPSR